MEPGRSVSTSKFVSTSKTLPNGVSFSNKSSRRQQPGSASSPESLNPDALLHRLDRAIASAEYSHASKYLASLPNSSVLDAAGPYVVRFVQRRDSSKIRAHQINAQQNAGSSQNDRMENLNIGLGSDQVNHESLVVPDEAYTAGKEALLEGDAEKGIRLLDLSATKSKIQRMISAAFQQLRKHDSQLITAEESERKA